MMRTLLYIGMGFIGVVVFLYAVLVWRTHRATARRDERVLDVLKPVMTRVSGGENVPPSEIAALAQDRLTRNRLYDALQTLGRVDLFPAELRTQVAFAESDLSYWLTHPNELGVPPDEIELAAQFTREAADGQSVDYYVFKFRVHPPHWSADKGWMVGVAGPYPHGEPPATTAAHTFSRFDRLDDRTLPEHLEQSLTALGSPLVR